MARNENTQLIMLRKATTACAVPPVFQITESLLSEYQFLPTFRITSFTIVEFNARSLGVKLTAYGDHRFNEYCVQQVSELVQGIDANKSLSLSFSKLWQKMKRNTEFLIGRQTDIWQIVYPKIVQT